MRALLTPRALAVPVFLLAWAAAMAQAPRATDARFAFTPAHESATARGSAFTWMDLPRPTPSAHASSIAELPDGALLVAWFGGAREGAADVGIEAALVRGGRVEAQWTALTRQRLQQMVQRVVRSIGNPVVWVDGRGRVNLFVVSVSYGGWSGSAINHLVSEDLGHSWTSARRLVVSSFFNLSTLVRNQPLPMDDGSVGLPAYHEFLEKNGLWVRLREDGSVQSARRMQKYEGSWLQPAVAALSQRDALALLRSGSQYQPVIGVNRTSDGGRTWPLRPALGIPNPNSAVSMIRLVDGTLLLAANPTRGGRGTLQLFTSADDGVTWVPARVIERDDAGEFSYPFLVEGRDGVIHLSYTWQRKGIRLCSLERGWLEGNASDAPAIGGAR